MNRQTTILCAAALLLAAGYPLGAGAQGRKELRKMKAGVVKSAFGTADGHAVDLYTLTNVHGLVAKITNYGAILTELHVPDRHGKMANVVLGFDNLKQYLAGDPYFGATVGRYANRIAKGKFTLDGKTYTLAVNNPPNSLHGGLKGFDKQVWHAQEVHSAEGPSVAFTYHSKDMEEGFPGNLDAKVAYTLTNSNAVKLEYTATTDKATPVNLTNHSYFNLSGEGSGDVLHDVVWINADHYTPVDATLIPTGKIASVHGTPLDFTKPHAIGARIKQLPGDPQGYDHNFVINGGGKSLVVAARVTDPHSGRQVEVLTTQPGVQLYTGNFLDGTLKGPSGRAYKIHDAFCLETQHFPDSPNHPNFPSTILKPGQTFHSVTEYRFSAK